MPRIFARHKVADFDAWKPHYDGDVERRKAAPSLLTYVRHGARKELE